MTTIGVLHPGAMGAAVGACLSEAGHEVLWASDGRSDATAERARAAGMSDAGDAASLAARCDVLLSICPPHAAVAVARSVGGFGGVFVDANAVSPETAAAIAAFAGPGYVDGGIIGPPPTRPGATRLYLSGERAGEVAAAFAPTRLDARAIEGDVTASACSARCGGREGLALGGRDAGDRRDVRRRGAAGRLPSRGRRGVRG